MKQQLYMKSSKFSLLLFYVIFLAILPTLKAKIGHFDHVWQRRLKEAREAAKQAYKPDPMKVTSDFNTHVKMYILPKYFLLSLCIMHHLNFFNRSSMEACIIAFAY